MPHCTSKTRGGKHPKKGTYKHMKTGTYKKRRGGGNILDQLQKDRLVGGRRKSMRRR